MQAGRQFTIQSHSTPESLHLCLRTMMMRIDTMLQMMLLLQTPNTQETEKIEGWTQSTTLDRTRVVIDSHL
jgi:hypothetical protein